MGENYNIIRKERKEEGEGGGGEEKEVEKNRGCFKKSENGMHVCMCIYEYSLSCHFLTSEHLISFIGKKNFFSLVCYF